MSSRILEHRNQLLDITKRKLELLTSVQENFDDIRENPVFVEETEELFLDLFYEEAELIEEKEMTMPCPGCGFDCARIASFCMVCGMKLHDDPPRQDM